EIDLRVLLDPPFLEGTITHSQVVLLDPVHLPDCDERIRSSTGAVTRRDGYT
ncbi:hypothetical protein PIB30_072553, partial [Stylosanthes scabra]|nr:hypothetical protein [Stylosanthes scabra]